MDDPKTILIIDDEPDVIASVESELTERDFRVASASKWTEAIAQFEEVIPDLVILDLQLPTVQGHVLLDFIREQNADLPVIILSEDISPEEMERLGSKGANGFIRKPFETENLLVILEQVLLDWGISETESGEEMQEEYPVPRPVEEEPDSTETQVSPGSGAQALKVAGGALQTDASSSPGRSRRSRRRRGGVKRLQNYLYIFVLCLFIGFLLWYIPNQFSGGLFGIGATPDAP